MGDKTGIEWTEATWNPIVGCSVVSPGCTNCYAMKQAERIQRMTPGSHYAGTTKAVNGNAVWTGVLKQAPENILLQPLKWKRPRRIFVNSMSDLFHDAVPDEWIDRVFAIMALCPQHTFQVLTKRSKRMRDYMTPGMRDANDRVYNTAYAMSARFQVAGMGPQWPLPNVWLGVSAEDQTRADERIPDLLATPAAVRFVSAEPLLGPIFFSESCGGGPGLPLDWIIVGGESGSGARHMDDFWALDIVRQCQSAKVNVFVKQLSGMGGRPVKDIALFPPALQVREYPAHG